MYMSKSLNLSLVRIFSVDISKPSHYYNDSAKLQETQLVCWKLQRDIVVKSHCFTVRLKILGVVSHQTLIISLQNWVKGSLIFNDIYYS